MKNKIVNGEFQVWQLGTDFVLGPRLQKNADRWNYDYNGTAGYATLSKVDLRSNGGLGFLNYYPSSGVRVVQHQAGTGNTFQDLSTQISGVNTLAGKWVTISFYAVSMANPESVLIQTEQFFGSGGYPTPPRFRWSEPIQIGTTWKRYSVTFYLDPIYPTDVFGSNDDDTLNVILTMPRNQYFDLIFTGVQCEEGLVVTDYESRPYHEVLSDCQKYLQTSYGDSVAPGTITQSGALSFVMSGQYSIFTIQMKSPMRTTPRITYFNPITGEKGSWSIPGSKTNVVTNTAGTTNISSITTQGVTGAFCTGHYILEDPYY